MKPIHTSWKHSGLKKTDKDIKIQVADIENKVIDVYGRTFKTLRVSLTENCNFACTYCVPGEVVNTKSDLQLTSRFNLVSTIKQLHHLLDFDTIRLTGGEPTLYKGLIGLVKELSVLNIPLKLTTNGFLLPSLAIPLAEAGIKSMNVSLDAVDEEVFLHVTRRKMLNQVLAGIQEARQAGMEVKINSVIMKGVNDAQVVPLFEYAKDHGISIRFLELMKMGHLYSADHARYFFSQEEILREITIKYRLTDNGRNPSATTNYWKTSDGYQFGIIANESAPFCNDCDRLRLDSKGNIFGCLSNNQSISLNNAMDETALTSLLKNALAHKQPAKFTGSEMAMIGIGG